MSETKPSEIYSAEDYIANVPAGDKDFEGEPVPNGKVAYIETLIVIDLTTAAKTIRLGYKRGGSTYWLKRETVGAAVYGLSLDRPLILAEGEYPVARIETATVNDDCYFHARGRYL